MTIRGGFGGLGIGWLVGPAEWPAGTGLKTGHYMVDEFGARGRQRSVRRWGRLWGSALGLGGVRSLTPQGVSYSGGLRLG